MLKTHCWSAAAWFAAILFFGQTRSMAMGIPLLFVAGLMQSFCMRPLASTRALVRGDNPPRLAAGSCTMAVHGLPPWAHPHRPYTRRTLQGNPSP